MHIPHYRLCYCMQAPWRIPMLIFVINYKHENWDNFGNNWIRYVMFNIFILKKLLSKTKLRQSKHKFGELNMHIPHYWLCYCLQTPWRIPALVSVTNYKHENWEDDIFTIIFYYVHVKSLSSMSQKRFCSFFCFYISENNLIYHYVQKALGNTSTPMP